MATKELTKPDAAAASVKSLKGIEKAAALLVAIGEQRASEIGLLMAGSFIRAGTESRRAFSPAGAV